MFSAFVTIALVHLAALAAPGPDFLFVTRTAVAESRARALMAAAGIAAGIAVWAGIAFLGLGWLFSQFAWLQRILAVAGGLFLLWTGLQMLRSAATPRGSESGELPPGKGHVHPFLFGFITNISNPKALVYFPSVFAAFLTPELSAAACWRLWTFVVLESFAWFGFVALVLGLPFFRVRYRRAGRVIDGVAGALFVLFGVGVTSFGVRGSV